LNKNLTDDAQWAKLILNKFSTCSKIIDRFCIARDVLEAKDLFKKSMQSRQLRGSLVCW